MLYLIEAIDEYAISSLPEYEGKKFQNAAKEGLTLSKNKEKQEQLKSEYEPLTKWLSENVLKDKVRMRKHYSLFIERVVGIVRPRPHLWSPIVGYRSLPNRSTLVWAGALISIASLSDHESGHF